MFENALKNTASVGVTAKLPHVAEDSIDNELNPMRHGIREADFAGLELSILGLRTHDLDTFLHHVIAILVCDTSHDVGVKL
jgi:hypothetical protein